MGSSKNICSVDISRNYLSSDIYEHQIEHFFPSRYLSEENVLLQWSKRNHNQILFCMLIAYTQIERDTV